MAEPVAIPGLAKFRADLRAINRAFPAQFRKAEAKAATVIAEDAAGRAPRGTAPLPKATPRNPNPRKKRLHEAIRPIPAGNKFYVGATHTQAPHAGVVHWGGTIRPRGVPIVFARRPFVIEAFDAQRDHFVDLLAEEIDTLASRAGWR